MIHRKGERPLTKRPRTITAASGLMLITWVCALNIQISGQILTTRSSTGCLSSPLMNVQPGPFFVLFEIIKLLLIPVRIPCFAMIPVFKTANRMLIGPLLGQDCVAVEEKQQGCEKQWDAPLVELNPVVREFPKVIMRKWRDHLSQTEGGAHG